MTDRIRAYAVPRPVDLRSTLIRANQSEHHDAAVLHVKAHRTDPYAYSRCRLHLENHIVRADEVTVDAERMLRHAPQNPVMIHAAQKAGLI